MSRRSGHAQLRHPARQRAGWQRGRHTSAEAGRAPLPLSREVTVTGDEAPVCFLCFPPRGPPVGSALPSTGSSGVSSPASQVLWRCATPWAPRAGLGCLRPALPCGAPVGSLPAVQNGSRGPGVRHPVPLAGSCRLETGRTSQVPGEPCCPCAVFFDPGRTGVTRPLRCAGAAPAMSTTKAPTTKNLSGLNGTA